MKIRRAEFDKIIYALITGDFAVRTAEMTMDVASAIGLISAELRMLGMKIVSGHNFAEYADLVAASNRVLTEHFAIDYHTLSPVEGFWIVLTDGSGMPAATVAARLDCLGPMTLAQHWKMYLPRIYSSKTSGGVTISQRQHGFCQEVSGRVAYLGEMWVDDKFRKQGLAKKLAMLVQLVALLQFDPDFIYCWMWEDRAKSGFAQACGFTEVVARGIRWENPPSNKPEIAKLWLAGNRKSRLFDLALNVLECALE